MSETDAKTNHPLPASFAARLNSSPWLLAILPALFTIALYWPATRCNFINYDDNEYVTSNFAVQQGLTWNGVKWAFVTPVAGNWHPLTMLSHMLDCQLFGMNPMGPHLVNLLLHAANTAMVFLLLQYLTGALWRSFLVAALFGFHPLHVESVAWVSERKDVLSTFFGLLSLIFYARYAKVESKKQKVESRNPDTNAGAGRKAESGNYLVSLLFLALGLMCKPMLVTWPFVMLLLDYWPLKRMRIADFGLRSENSPKGFAHCTTEPHLHPPGRHPLTLGGEGQGEGATLDFEVHGEVRVHGEDSNRFSIIFHLLLEKIPFFILVAASSIVTFMVQKQGGYVAVVEKLPMGPRFENTLISYCRYLGKIFWPTDMAVFYPHPVNWPVMEVVAAGILLAGISVMLWLTRRSWPFMLMGWLWFLGTLVPVIGIVQVGGQSIADRYAYVPSVGVFILAIWGANQLACRWRFLLKPMMAAGVVALIVCIPLTWLQLGYWQNSITVMRHAVEVTKDNDVAYNNLGAALGEIGQQDEAIRQFQEAIRIKPNDLHGYMNIGSALAKKGEFDEAISEYQKVIKLNPNFAGAYKNLGTAFLRKGQLDDAITQYQIAIRLQPENVETHFSLGNAFARKGRFDDAISQYREVIRLDPYYTEAYSNLGTALESKGQLDDAIRQFQKAIQLEPGDALACNNLGNVLYGTGKIDEAILQYKKAIQLNPDFAEAHNNLGTAIEKKGRLDEAIGQFQEAVRLNPKYEQARYNLGKALYAKGRIDDAIVQFQAANQLDPYDAEVCNNLGIALYVKGRLDEAIEQYQQAIRLRPAYAQAYYNLGNALYGKGRLDDAISQFQDAVKLNPTYAAAYNSLGIVLAGRGRLDDAIAAFQEADRLNPNNPQIKNNLVRTLQRKDGTNGVETLKR